MGASSGTNYIRVDLYKDGTQNYFGETYNGNDWYSGSDGKQYFPITIIDSKSTASAVLQARTGVPSISDYDGQGSYKMRIRRYTASGGQGSEDPNSSAVSVAITISTPTPTPTFTPQPTATPRQSLVATVTPSATKSPTPSPNSLAPTPTVSPEDNAEDILGESTQSANQNFENDASSQQSLAKEEIVLSDKTSNIPKFLIVIGFIFILACAILFFWPHIKSRIKKHEENI